MIYSQREIVHRDKDKLLWKHYSSRLLKVKIAKNNPKNLSLSEDFSSARDQWVESN